MDKKHRVITCVPHRLITKETLWAPLAYIDVYWWKEMCGKNSKSKVHTPMKASDCKWITLITITRIYFLGLRLQTGGPAHSADTPCIWPLRITREEICVYGCAVQGPLKLWWKRMVITILVLKVLLRASIGMWYTSLSQSDAEDKLVPGASGIIHTTIQMTHLATYLRTGPTSVSSAGAINE